jgi:hypothetical protein
MANTRTKESFCTVGECALCLQNNELQNSHIIPAFAFRWLRSRFLTGHIRHTQKPNLRVQDGAKMPMLCAACEVLLSKDENPFASQLFHPMASDCRTVAYGDWLLRFAVSLSWRVLKYCYGRNPDATYTDQQQMLVAQADAIWREFLLAARPHPGKFEQHLLVFTPLTGEPQHGLPDNINRYLLGGIEMDIVGGERSLMTFTKIGPFVFFGFIQRPSGIWENTKIHVKDGSVTAGKFQAPHSLGDFFIGRANDNKNALTDGMSIIQKQKAQDELDKAIVADPKAFLSTHQGKAMIADARMFGEGAILRKRD